MASSSIPPPSDWMIPIGEFSQSVDFAINVSAPLGMAEGFIIEESRVFKLDTRSCKVTYGTHHESYDCNDVIVYHDEIYVHRRLLQRWLPVNLTVDSLHSQILVIPRERLPVELRKDREMLAERSKSHTGAFDPGYPRMKVPYNLLEGPSLDEQLTLGMQENAGVATPQFQHSTQIGGSCIGLETLAYLNGNQREFQNWRLSFARRSPDASLFGPLHLREIQLFNLISPQIPLITNGQDGRGFMISSYPLIQPGTFENQNFEGNLPAGWEVDLYRNDILIDRQINTPNGRYAFMSIPLLYGRNIFRLTFFGPQGQRRDEYQTFNISPEMIEPGTHDFRLSLSQLNTGPQRFSFQYAENISRNFTANVGLLQDHGGGDPTRRLG